MDPKGLNDIQATLVLLLAAIVASVVAYFVVASILKVWHRRRGEPARRMKPHVQYFGAPLRLLLPAIALDVVLPYLTMPARERLVSQHVLTLWLIVAVAWLVVRVIRFFRDVILGRYDIQQADNLHARRMYTQIRLIERIIVIGVWVLAAAAMLMSFTRVRAIGVSLLASAGAMSIVLGLAAQRTLGNVIAGIQIAIAQPIRLEDAVVVEGEWGWIEEITLTYVVVKIWDLRRLIVPISYFVEKPFQNWTRTSADLLGSVFIYADYTLPVQAVRDELQRILEASTRWDRKVSVLQVVDATERTLQLRALMSAPDSPTAWDLRCEVREKLITFLQERFPDSLPRVRLESEERPEQGQQE
ncbi:MAG: mechanosensitive ion channel family protein [Gemmatimonadota bacterium]